MNLQQALYEVEIYGFTLVENVLSGEEVIAMREALIRAESTVGDEQRFLGKASHVANLPTLDSLFLEIVDHPKIMPVLEGVLGTSIILGSLNARIVRPDDPQQGLHSDIRQDLLNMASPVMMNTVWLLDDFTSENGATRIVPGSHKSGLNMPPEDMEIKHVVEAIAPAGSVLIFNGQCWHGGGKNNSNRNRHALFGHYRKNALVFQVDPHDDFPPEWVDQLTDRQKELLRMHNGLNVPHAADSHMRLSFSSGKTKK
ncbi:MAG: phytanoyl-CoA dioxygenase family protein [Chloroflexota bacterium]